MEAGFKMETGQLSAVAIIVNAYLNLDHQNKILFIRFFVSKINKTEFEFLNQTIDIRRQVKQEQNDLEDVGNDGNIEDTGNVDIENVDDNDNIDENRETDEADNAVEAESSESTDVLKEDVDPWYENPKTLCNISFAEGDFKISFDDALKDTVDKYVDGVKSTTKFKKRKISKETFPCDLCDKKFHQKHNYILHRRVHTGEKPFACDQCTKTFKDSRVLIFHKRQHSGEKPYLCDQCPKAFTTKQGINKHKIIHTGERPFKCDECEKTFTQAVHMREHKRIHSGEKPYFCDQCPKAFNESGNLKQHQRTHSGEKPFQCDQCPKTFSGPSDLKKHKNFHLKPYSCDYCQKTFSRLTYLKGHLASNHSLENSLDPKAAVKVSKSSIKSPEVSISSLIPLQPTEFNKHLSPASARSEEIKIPQLVEYDKQLAEECSKHTEHDVARLMDYRHLPLARSSPTTEGLLDYKQRPTTEGLLDYKQHTLAARSHLSGVAYHSVEALRMYEQSRAVTETSSYFKHSGQESSHVPAAGVDTYKHQMGLGTHLSTETAPFKSAITSVTSPMEYKSPSFI